jgi:hypothetical protein
MTKKEMKELNKRLVEKLPENRAKSSIREYELRKRDELSQRKIIMNDYSKKLKENVVSKTRINN